MSNPNMNPGLIKAVINKAGGVARTNKYRVLFPRLNKSAYSLALDVLCSATGLPGKNITTVPRRTSMKEIQTPTGYTLEPVEMTFTELENNVIMDYFEEWMDSIVDPVTHAVAYRHDISKEVIVWRLGVDGKMKHGFALKRAFPKARPTVVLGDEQSDEIMKIQIQMEYEDYEVLQPRSS